MRIAEAQRRYPAEIGFLRNTVGGVRLVAARALAPQAQGRSQAAKVSGRSRLLCQAERQKPTLRLGVSSSSHAFL